MKRPKLAAVFALAGVLTVAGFTALPVLATGVGDTSPASCDQAGGVADDGTPSIIGPSTLTAADLDAWWDGTGRGQPPRLRIAIADLIALYITEGDAEGVRGDLAFAQAVLETGYFTNRDTVINNYAGIAHYDNAASGSAFRDPIIGVRAQIQLLKKFALGNQAPLANPDVGTRAGASATTWGGLAGTWATATNYWTALNAIYQTMLHHAARTFDSTTSPAAGMSQCAGTNLIIDGNYALPVERRWYDAHPDWFTQPHHDYPAIDIPVPIGTRVYAVTSGVVVATPTDGKCGTGIVFSGDDAAQYTYCHGRPGTQIVVAGDRVTAGQHIMDSASTGNSTGPHLHFGIDVHHAKRCPQPFLVAIATAQSVSSESLPTTGCIS
jgi:hypothetical protein